MTLALLMGSLQLHCSCSHRIGNNQSNCSIALVLCHRIGTNKLHPLLRNLDAEIPHNINVDAIRYNVIVPKCSWVPCSSLLYLVPLHSTPRHATQLRRRSCDATRRLACFATSVGTRAARPREGDCGPSHLGSSHLSAVQLRGYP